MSPPSNQYGLPWYKTFIAGAAAGVTEVLVMYPLDVVKTRFQLQTGPVGRAAAGASSQSYTSIVDAFSKIIRHEGFFNLYRGIISPILAEAPKRAAKFTFNDIYQNMLRDKNGHLAEWKYVLAGSLAGASEGLINCPFEVVKVRMQAKENLSVYKNTTDAAMKLLMKEGPLALYNGIEPQLWRNVVWNGTYFATIHKVKTYVNSQGSTMNEELKNFLAGTIAGALATTLNTPLDVVKSRLQKGGAINGPSWALPHLVFIFRNEGFRALYKGYTPRILRLGPGGGIMMLAFDFVARMLK